VIVVLDLASVLDVFGDEQIEPSAGSRVPGEFLYLDDERVDAYLGQLQGGLSSTEQRSISLTERHEAQAGFDPVVQVGGGSEQKEVINRTVEPNAADRFFLLQSELEARFTQADERGPRFMEIKAADDACPEMKSLKNLKEGQILRILGANLLVPTYALALAKLAHADQFRADGQKKVLPERLAQLAPAAQRGLQQLVKRLRADPRLPFWLKLHPNSRRKAARYSCRRSIPR
jgi:hypothetical protein